MTGELDLLALSPYTIATLSVYQKARYATYLKFCKCAFVDGWDRVRCVLNREVVDGKGKYWAVCAQMRVSFQAGGCATDEENFALGSYYANRSDSQVLYRVFTSPIPEKKGYSIRKSADAWWQYVLDGKDTLGLDEIASQLNCGTATVEVI